MGEGGALEGDDGAPVPALQSARLVLRAPERGDAADVARLAGDLEVSRWLSRVPHPYGPEDARHFVEEIAPREPTWAITLGGGPLVGFGGFAPRWRAQDMEFGYWIGRPFWGRGFATEAGALMLGEAWRRGARAVLAGCFDGNARSDRVLAKLGFRPAGRGARPCLALGRAVPSVEMRCERPPGGA